LTQPANKSKPKAKKQPKTNCPTFAAKTFSFFYQSTFLTKHLCKKPKTKKAKKSSVHLNTNYYRLEDYSENRVFKEYRILIAYLEIFSLSSERFNRSSRRLLRSLVSRSTKEAKARIEKPRPIFLSNFITPIPHYDILRMRAFKANFKKTNISNNDICSRKSSFTTYISKIVHSPEIQFYMISKLGIR
jgi:hypothetical protein